MRFSLLLGRPSSSLLLLLLLLLSLVVLLGVAGSESELEEVEEG